MLVEARATKHGLALAPRAAGVHQSRQYSRLTNFLISKIWMDCRVSRQDSLSGPSKGTGHHGQAGLPGCAECAPATCVRHVQEVRRASNCTS